MEFSEELHPFAVKQERPDKHYGEGYDDSALWNGVAEMTSGTEFEEKFHSVALNQERPDDDDSTMWNGGPEMITVKVEPVDAGLAVPDDFGSQQKLHQEDDYEVAYPGHFLENPNPAHFYIAHLSQKLNLKLNTVLSPKNDNSTSDTAELHKNRHSGENFQGKALECSWCSATVASIEDLKQHQLDCDGCPSSKDSSLIGKDGIKRQYTCDVCDEDFTQKWCLERHYRSHADSRRIVCFVCEASFSTAQNLQVHLITHLKNMPYICPKCNRGFPNREVLKEHARVHIKDMKFSCRFCGKRFMQAKNLNFHMKVHSGVKIYPCDECEQGFDTAKERTAHKKQHELFMPYKCALCNQSFRTKRQREKHSVIHDVENH